MKQPKPILITEKLASVYPDELKLTPEQAFQAFDLEFRPEYKELRLDFTHDDYRDYTEYSLSLYGKRMETLEEAEERQRREDEKQSAQKEEQKNQELQELARLKKKYEKTL
jgi:hypothetical protein